jgi:hypothetical protein
VKQLPILVRYFQAYDLENELKNKLLTFVEISVETADIKSMQVIKAIVKYDLETKVVRLSTDNTTKTSEACSERVKKMC